MNIQAGRAATLLDILRATEVNRPALVNTDANGLNYGELASLVDETQRFLAEQGIGPQQTVATSMPNSLEAAALLIGLTTYCAAAPLNPDYTAHEALLELNDLGPPAALIVCANHFTAARAVAEAHGVQVIELRPDGSGRGWFTLQSAGTRRRVQQQPLIESLSTNNIALLLHTSGTTARPKLVPLTRDNLGLSAAAVAQVLQLTPDDRCLSVMPLFHIHGLVAGLFASISAGACVCCTGGFQATSFVSWLQSSKASWYTAVPTMHQAVLTRARRFPDLSDRHSLRLIRSSSAPLFPTVWNELQTLFEVPVLNSYGMTEAAHQIASVRQSGESRDRTSVGLSSGPDITIMNTRGELVPAGHVGEVALRGRQIMSGYLLPAGANDAAFRNGWFLTGDEGFLDAAGQLTLTGRLKEMINSGGEKISPYQVEEALLTHPGVAEAVVFAAPHEMLGEQVVAAVVLQSGCVATERELLAAAGQCLTRCKLPRRIIVVDYIPRGATGKLQRIGLAKSLGLVETVTVAGS